MNRMNPLAQGLGFSPTESQTRHMIQECLQLLDHYDWLINSMVLDYFIESLWSKLASSWQCTLSRISPSTLGSWLSNGNREAPLEQECDSLLPLSLIALKAVISKLSLNRLPSQNLNLNDDVIPVLSHQELDPLFRRKVNPKKEHELRVFAPLIHSMAEMTSTSAVFDFGSGIGHLCRRLSFIHGLHSFGLETQEVLTVKAKEMDELFVKKMKSRSPSSHILPVHSVHNISEETLQSHTQDSLFKNQEHHGVGLVGLHACGDLSSRIIRLYKASSSSKFLCLATCCYMKGNLNLMSSDFSHRSLSYEARELGCHALETYIKKLKSDDYESLLRVHCYRALLERILIRKGSQYKHISLKSVPQTHRLSFEEYALAATANLKELNISATEMKEAEMDLEKEWWKVSVFYILRLSMAPIIETLVFLDRYLFLKEACDRTSILPLFDPVLSPRNLVLLSIK